MKFNTKRVDESGVLIALATILSFIKISPQFLYGGGVTVFSMVPLCVLACKYGTAWGLCCGLCYGALQMIWGAAGSQAFAGLTPLACVVMAMLDYVVAYGVIGFAGAFCTKGRASARRAVLGGAMAVGLRYAAHFLSGVVLWGSYAEWFFAENMNNAFGQGVLARFSGTGLACIYSAVYNGLYMVPEIILTAFGLWVIFGVRPLRKAILGERSPES